MTGLNERSKANVSLSRVQHANNGLNNTKYASNSSNFNVKLNYASLNSSSNAYASTSMIINIGVDSLSIKGNHR